MQITGTSWSDAAALTLTTTSNAALPAADFAEVSKTGEEFELGTQFNLWLVNPQELANFQVIYGDRWKAVLQSWGVDMFASNLVTAGSAYVVAERQVGEMRFEKPLSTATWREEERETTWYRRPCDRCSR